MSANNSQGTSYLEMPPEGYDGGAIVEVSASGTILEVYLDRGGFGAGGSETSTSVPRGGGGGLGVKEGRVPETPKDQNDCLNKSLGAIKADYAFNLPIARSEPINSNFPDGGCFPNQSLQENIKDFSNQIPHRKSGTIYLPELSANTPWVLDPNAPGSVANLATRSIQSVNDMKNCTDPTIRAIGTLAMDAAAGKTGTCTYSAFLGVLLTPDFVKAMGWNEATCRAFVINHERAHGALQDSLPHLTPGDTRFNALFSADGTPSVDGLGLLMTLADQGNSQADGIQNLINLLDTKIEATQNNVAKAALNKIKDALKSAKGKFSC